MENEQRTKIKLEFDNKIVTTQEYLQTLGENDVDPETRLNRAQINAQAKLMAKHTVPPITFMDVMKMPFLDFMENLMQFMKLQGLEVKNPFLENSQ